MRLVDCFVQQVDKLIDPKPYKQDQLIRLIQQ